jgi:hypothetical protein
MFYRNRLVRCYLGASNEQRLPNLFTGFCEGDDLSLKDLVSNRRNPGATESPEKNSAGDSAAINSEFGYDGPYPVLNTSLNLVKGKDLAWQQRKAESFILSPLFCGYDVWLEEQDSPVSVKERDPLPKTGQPRKTSQKLDRFGYRPTHHYAFPPPRWVGPKLGLSMAISGAAVSPSMGFYSTPPVGFLMTVFDVRLGQWLGNPRNPTTWTNPTPTFGLAYLMKELVGGTDDNAPYVYLSDGGHFENMGLYEMVKRRCGLVIVCDAEADGDYKFAGIGNAIRKCRIDLGIDIQLDISAIIPDPATKLSKSHCAVGTIHYENADPNAPTGTIVYVKASLAGDEPTDVKNYSKTCPAFPHESTVDQWFTETQFESYRALGYHIVSSSVRTPATGIAPPAAATGAGNVAAEDAKHARTSPARVDVKLGEHTVPLELNVTLQEQPCPPAAAPPSPVPTTPGPGSIPLSPQTWSAATVEAIATPLYERVQTAMWQFGFDVDPWADPDLIKKLNEAKERAKKDREAREHPKA